MSESEMLEAIANQLKGIAWEDLNEAEVAIAKILMQNGYLSNNEYGELR